MIFFSSKDPINKRGSPLYPDSRTPFLHKTHIIVGDRPISQIFAIFEVIFLGKDRVAPSPALESKHIFHMKTVYSNTSHPKFIKWSSIVAAVIGLTGIGLYLFQAIKNDILLSILYISSFSLVYAAVLYGEYKLLTLTIDEEADTITDSRLKKYPLKISQIKTATYKESRKGKFRSLFLHDTGVGFMDIRTSRENADRIVAQIRKVNPAVEVVTANYL